MLKEKEYIAYFWNTYIVNNIYFVINTLSCVSAACINLNIHNISYLLLCMNQEFCIDFTISTDWLRITVAIRKPDMTKYGNASVTLSLRTHICTVHIDVSTMERMRGDRENRHLIQTCWSIHLRRNGDCADLLKLSYTHTHTHTCTRIHRVLHTFA